MAIDIFLQFYIQWGCQLKNRMFTILKVKSTRPIYVTREALNWCLCLTCHQGQSSGKSKPQGQRSWIWQSRAPALRHPRHVAPFKLTFRNLYLKVIIPLGTSSLHFYSIYGFPICSCWEQGGWRGIILRGFLWMVLEPGMTLLCLLILFNFHHHGWISSVSAQSLNCEVYFSFV